MSGVIYFTWEAACFDRDGYLGSIVECEDYASAVWVARRWLRRVHNHGAIKPDEYRPLVKLCYLPTRRYGGKRYLPDKGRAVPKERCYSLYAFASDGHVTRIRLEALSDVLELARSWLAECRGNTYRIVPKYRLVRCANGMPMYFRYPASSSISLHGGI